MAIRVGYASNGTGQSGHEIPKSGFFFRAKQEELLLQMGRDPLKIRVLNDVLKKGFDRLRFFF